MGCGGVVICATVQEPESHLASTNCLERNEASKTEGGRDCRLHWLTICYVIGSQLVTDSMVVPSYAPRRMIISNTDLCKAYMWVAMWPWLVLDPHFYTKRSYCFQSHTHAVVGLWANGTSHHCPPPYPHRHTPTPRRFPWLPGQPLGSLKYA